MNWKQYQQALDLIPAPSRVKAMEKNMITGLMVRVSKKILTDAVEVDANGVGDDVDMICIKRCGEVLILAGSYHDRPKEQLIDALKYVHEYYQEEV